MSLPQAPPAVTAEIAASTASAEATFRRRAPIPTAGRRAPEAPRGDRRRLAALRRSSGPVKIPVVATGSQPPTSAVSGSLVAGVGAPPGAGTPPVVGDLDRTFDALVGAGVGGVAVHGGVFLSAESADPDREASVRSWRTALDRAGLHAGCVSAALDEPAFRHGALAANRPAVRRMALRRVLDAIDLAAELGAPLVLLDTGYEPVGRGLEQDVPAALDCLAEAVNGACEYVVDRGYEIEVVIVPSAGSLLPGPGHALAFVHELDRPSIVGLAPSLDRGTGIAPFHQEVAQALWADKLFHIGLAGVGEAVAPGSGAGRRDALLLIDLLRDAEWDGTRRLGDVPLRSGSDDEPGPGPAWRALRHDVAAHRALEAAAAALRADPEVAGVRSAVAAGALDDPTLPDGFSPESFAELRSPEAERDDRDDLPGDTDAEARERAGALLDTHLASIDPGRDAPPA